MTQAPKNFKPEPFEYHQEIELTIDTLTNLGTGLGRIDNWVVMVPFTLPSERVRVRIYKNHKNFSEGDLVEILEASPDRIPAKCPLFGTCGGCQYQHLEYSKQLEWKTNQVSELLERLAEIKTEVNPTIGSPEQFNYRSKLTPHYPRPNEMPVPLGFLKQGTRHNVIDVEQCPIASHAINDALPQIRTSLQEKVAGKKRAGTILIRSTDKGVTTNPKATVIEKIGELKFQFIAGEFFQNNPHILPSFVDYAIKQAKSQGDNYLVDAYCGVGVFSICASKHFEECVGVEINQNAITLAAKNAQYNEAYNVVFQQGSSEAIFADLDSDPADTSILLDPPRKGCDEAFLEQLIAFNPNTIVYVSCGPDTQARDLKHLTQNGYKIKDVQPFDLFPQTRHIENIVTLHKIKA